MTRQQNDGPGPAAKGLRALIVEDDTLVGIGLRAQLEKLGHNVIAQAANGEEARKIFLEAKPELVLMDIRLDQTDGIELAGELLAERQVPMIIVSAYSDRELIDRAAAAGVFGYFVKPVSGEALAAQIGVVLTRFAEYAKLLEQNHELLQTLETRKLVERAKGILMRRLSLAEPDAHRRLQQESQKRRISIAEIAKRIIESEELFST